MMLNYFKDTEKKLQEKIDNNLEGRNARKRYSLEVAKFGTRLYSKGESMAWCGIITPFDILNSMGITSCFVEFNGAILASAGLANDFLNEAEQMGFAVESCAYHKSIFGAVTKEAIPVPDFVIGSTAPCVAGLAVLENIARIYKKPFFVLNIPQEETAENIKYLCNQMKEMVKFVSEHTGRSFDYDKFKSSVEYSNRATELLTEIYNMSKKKPSPAHGRIFKDFGIVLPLFWGTEGVIEICEEYIRELKAITDSGSSGMPGEKIRLMWIQNRIQFKHSLEKFLEIEFKANIVIDELNDVVWPLVDPDDPFTGIALRLIKNPLCLTAETRINHMKKLAKEYKINGAINPCHWGCRQGTGIRGLIGHGLKEINVPVLNLEIDCIDTRNYTEGQIKTRVEAFLEMLDNRPSPWEG